MKAPARESMIRIRLGQRRPAFEALRAIDAEKRIAWLSGPKFMEIVVERGIVAMIEDLPPAQAAKVRKAAGAASSSSSQ